MKTVLIVDDTKLMRTFLPKQLAPYADEFSVATAENGQEALEYVQTVKTDLVITDVEMPVMDGFELLVQLSNNYPEIPVFVMTANGSPELQERIDAMGSLKYFEKPINIDSLLGAIREIFESSARGEVNGISLASFLQLVGMESKTCTLRVKSMGQVGQLYCLKGELIAAEVGDLTAEKAAVEMISWDSAVIEILTFNKQKEQEIKQPLMNILMEGSRRKDERAAAKKSAPPKKPLKSKPKPNPAPTTKEKPSGPKDDGGGAPDLSGLYEWD